MLYTEKNSLLAYVPDTANPQRIVCKEMDDKRNITEYTSENFVTSIANLGAYLDNQENIGTNIPIFMETSYNFLRTFLGIIAAKKVAVPLHTISNDDVIEFSLRKVRATAIFVADPWLYQKLAKINYVRQHIQTIFCTPAILAEKSLLCRHVDFTEIFSRPQPLEHACAYLENKIQNTNRDETIEIVFTSGTTGEPKGAVLSHRNVVACIVRAGNHLRIDSTYRTLTFLPLSHVMAQNEVFIAVVAKAIVQIVGRDNLLHGLKVFKPNILVSVPRVYQAIHQGIQKKLRHQKLPRILVNWAVKVYRNSKQAASLWLRMIYFILHQTLGRLITSKIRQNIGQFKLLATAGAACPAHIYEFFEAIRMPLTNAQGLTEVAGAVIYNTPNETIDCSIGYPLPGVQVKIDDDGEILMKGDPVFSGYFEAPQYNARSFTPDGWFRTGDWGEIREIHGRQYVFLKGRKSEILVLSSGLNIPAAQIEDRLVQNEIIHQAMVVGDGQSRLAALIVPHPDYCKRSNLKEEISKAIRQFNSQLDASEQIGEFEILPEPFTIENGMLTPTLKVRRMVVSQRYQSLIGNMYHSMAC